MTEPFTIAARIVGDAENNLKKLLSETLEDDDYSFGEKLLEWARNLSDLRLAILEAAHQVRSRPLRAGARETGGREIGRALRRARKQRASNYPPRKPRAGVYPKFWRNGDTLVLTRWSNEQKREYERTSPLSVLMDLTVALSSVIDRKNRFAMEAIMPLRSSRGSEYPATQVYDCLAFLRAKGLVVWGGRLGRGYEIKPNIDLNAKVKELVKLLPEKRNKRQRLRSSRNTSEMKRSAKASQR